MVTVAVIVPAPDRDAVPATAIPGEAVSDPPPDRAPAAACPTAPVAPTVPDPDKAGDAAGRGTPEAVTVPLPDRSAAATGRGEPDAVSAPDPDRETGTAGACPTPVSVPEPARATGPGLPVQATPQREPHPSVTVPPALACGALARVSVPELETAAAWVIVGADVAVAAPPPDRLPAAAYASDHVTVTPTESTYRMPELVELLCVPATLTPRFAICARVTPVNVCTRAAEPVVRVMACDEPINVDPSRSCTDAADTTVVLLT